MELQTSTTGTYSSLEEEEEVPVIEDHQEQEEALALAWPRRTQRGSYRRRRRSQEREYFDDFFQLLRSKRLEMPLTVKEATKPREVSLKEEEATKPREMPLTVKEATKPPKMSLRVQEVIKLLSSLWKFKEVKVAVKHSLRGALITGAMTFIGGLVGGPPGIAVGGAIGGLLGAWMSRGQFKSVPEILMELPRAKQEKLLSQVTAIVSHLQWTDVEDLIKQVMCSEALQKQLRDVLIDFLTKALGTKVQYVP